jgi:hypothetical protein
MMEVPQRVLGANLIEEILILQGINLVVLIILIRFLENQKKISILRDPIDIQISGTSLKTPNFRMSMSNLILIAIQVSQAEEIVKVAVVVIPLLSMIERWHLNFCGGVKLLSLDEASPVIFLLVATVIETLNLNIKQEKDRGDRV